MGGALEITYTDINYIGTSANLVENQHWDSWNVLVVQKEQVIGGHSDMQMCHSDVHTFRSARERPISNHNCRRSFPFRDVLILYISKESQDDSCGLWMFVNKPYGQLWGRSLWTFEAFWLAQALNMTKRFRLPSWYKLTILPWVSRFLTFLTTRLPISWFLVKYHSEMKCFFVQ